MTTETEQAVREAWERFDSLDGRSEERIDAAIRADERARIARWLRSVGVFGGVCDAIERGDYTKGEP